MESIERSLVSNKFDSFSLFYSVSPSSFQQLFLPKTYSDKRIRIRLLQLVQT